MGWCAERTVQEGEKLLQARTFPDLTKSRFGNLKKRKKRELIPLKHSCTITESLQFHIKDFNLSCNCDIW